MKRVFLMAGLSVMLMAGTSFAQGFGPDNGTGSCNFIDEDGDGFNDLAPDADGDGIPNGLDPDYESQRDGTGEQREYQNKNQNENQHKYGVDADDGLLKEFGDDLESQNKYAYKHAYKGESQSNGIGEGSGNAYGPGDGSGFGPGDGTGFGPGDGTGECDGTGDTGESTHGNRGGRR